MMSDIEGAVERNIAANRLVERNQLRDRVAELETLLAARGAEERERCAGIREPSPNFVKICPPFECDNGHSLHYCELRSNRILCAVCESPVKFSAGPHACVAPAPQHPEPAGGEVVCDDNPCVIRKGCGTHTESGPCPCACHGTGRAGGEGA